MLDAGEMLRTLGSAPEGIASGSRPARAKGQRYGIQGPPVLPRGGSLSRGRKTGG